MLRTKLHRNRPTGSWKQACLGIYTIYGHGSHLGHVTSIMLINFPFLVPQNLIQNLVENGQVVFEKSKFQYLYINNLGQSSRNDIDLQYSLSFTGLVVCIYKFSGHCQQQFLKISTVFRFFLYKSLNYQI